MEIINLNLIPGKAWPVAHATQFDKGREFRANLFEGSQVYTLAGDETVDAIVKKPDGNQVIETLVNTADNYVIVTTTEQMTAVAGPSLGEIRITKDDTVIGSLKFILECEQSADTGIESHSEINNLETQVAAIVADQYDADNVVFDAAPTAGHGVGFAVTSEGVANAVDGAKQYTDDEIGALTIPANIGDLGDVTVTTPTNGEILVYNNGVFENQANPASTVNFAPDYDDTATYNAPDKVIHQGLLYTANDDNITGTWDSTKWTQTTVSALTASSLPLTSNPSEGTTKEAIDELSEVTTGTLTAGTNITINRYTLIKVGKVKMISMLFQRTGAATTIATVPQSFAPEYNVDYNITFSDGSGSRGRLTAGDNDLQWSDIFPINTWGVINFMYV